MTTGAKPTVKSEFEEELGELSSRLSEEGKELANHVFGLEFSHEFGERTQLGPNFAAKALKLAADSGPGSEEEEEEESPA
jgi:hypothetical protein